jgi:hypothetical protein
MVTINLQIRVHTVISVLPLLCRRAASDIRLFGFTFFDYPETKNFIGYAMLKTASMECGGDCLFADVDRAC